VAVALVRRAATTVLRAEGLVVAAHAAVAAGQAAVARAVVAHAAVAAVIPAVTANSRIMYSLHVDDPETFGAVPYRMSSVCRVRAKPALPAVKPAAAKQA